MVRVKEIVIRRLEGTKEEVRKIHTVKSFEDANSVLNYMARTAPTKGHGYDKCTFRIDFEDGFSYTGRYDLSRDEYADLADHIRVHLEVLAGKRRPDHLSIEAYNNLLDTLGKRRAEYERILETYAI